MVSGVPLEYEGLVPKQELGNQDSDSPKLILSIYINTPFMKSSPSPEFLTFILPCRSN
jgi:hypothetical protein